MQKTVHSKTRDDNLEKARGPAGAARLSNFNTAAVMPAAAVFVVPAVVAAVVLCEVPGSPAGSVNCNFLN